MKRLKGDANSMVMLGILFALAVITILSSGFAQWGVDIGCVHSSQTPGTSVLTPDQAALTGQSFWGHPAVSAAGSLPGAVVTNPLSYNTQTGGVTGTAFTGTESIETGVVTQTGNPYTTTYNNRLNPICNGANATYAVVELSSIFGIILFFYMFLHLFPGGEGSG